MRQREEWRVQQKYRTFKMYDVLSVTCTNMNIDIGRHMLHLLNSSPKNAKIRGQGSCSKLFEFLAHLSRRLRGELLVYQ